MYFRILTTCVLALMAAPALGQVHAHQLEHFDSDRFREAGDWNGDGFDDLLRIRGVAGSLEVLSGVDRSVLTSIAVPLPSPVMLGAAAMVSDMNADGIRDILASIVVVNGQSLHPGLVGISGATGTALFVRPAPAGVPDYTREIEPVADVDGDGIPEFVLATFGGPWFAAFNILELRSGATGAVLSIHVPPAAGRVVPVPDIDLDGHDDVLLGMGSGGMSPSGGFGRVQVLSGLDLSVLNDWLAPSQAGWFGNGMDAIGDIDSDGFVDIAVGAPSHGYTTWDWPGCVSAWSGRTGAMLWRTDGPGGNLTLGWAVNGIGDIDGDGIGDLAAASWHKFGSGQTTVSLLSGIDGSVLSADIPASAVFEGCGLIFGSMRKAGDLNADGTPELLLDLACQHGGSVMDVMIVGTPPPRSYCTATTDSAGCVPHIWTNEAGSLSVGDEIRVRVTSTRPNRAHALLWSRSSMTTPFGGGTSCVGPVPAARIDEVRFSPASATCESGLDFALGRTALLAHGLTPGEVIYTQVFSRDPGFAPPNNFGMTSAIAITLAP